MALYFFWLLYILLSETYLKFGIDVIITLGRFSRFKTYAENKRSLQTLSTLYDTDRGIAKRNKNNRTF